MTASPSHDSGGTHPRHSHSLAALIEHLAHLLPSQGPIEVFVHHNTLHAFEDESFGEAVLRGSEIYGARPFLPEAIYRESLKQGRIRREDLDAILESETSAGDAASLTLKRALLINPIFQGTAAELDWMLAESDAFRTFRSDLPEFTRSRLLAATQTWARNRRDAGLTADVDLHCLIEGDDASREAATVRLLWETVRRAVSNHRRSPTSAAPQSAAGNRHRDTLLREFGVDSDQTVHDSLIRFTAAYLDQGFADRPLPNRDLGLFRSFLDLYRQPATAPTRWFRALQCETRRVIDAGLTPLQSIEESLSLLGVTDAQRETYLLQSLLALRGWAGMVWQMETNAEWMPRPAPPGTLVEFLAVRLILDRLVVEQAAREFLEGACDLRTLRDVCSSRPAVADTDRTARIACRLFELAQFLEWTPEQLAVRTDAEWSSIIATIERFSEFERCRIYHLAYERSYRTASLDALVVHSRRQREAGESRPARPEFQLICCIDDREESFRRHLEEIAPDCETFGLAGFFGVAMYYRGASDAHFKPLCPVNVKPRHFVTEEPLFSRQESERVRTQARRQWGHAQHRTHRQSRTFLGGILTGLFGSLAAFPLVARVLFPRATARIRDLFSQLVRSPGTELHLERTEPEPGDANGHIGYTVDEMAQIVAGGLTAIGLNSTDRLAPLILLCGHGSSSLNNPHESAYNCGACSGARGGPNARAFARMANDPRVRQILARRGLAIPEQTWFVGGYHNTCDDSLTFHDLDLLPVGLRPKFLSARAALEEARIRNSHERCRRFESVPCDVTPEEALRQVESRAQDLSQARPEYNHATNALCFVGRRDWSRGLFLDRRAFLASYDPARDDDNSSVLERLLQAVIPVCAGISLEYYFSTVDPEQYGCGSKLPHNIASLLGVMSGAASDLRTGLSAQMVEIHEPMRILFVIETTPEALLQIVDRNASIAQLVRGDWVKLATFDPETSSVQLFSDGEFRPYCPDANELPQVPSSREWFQGNRGHLGFASIQTAFNSNRDEDWPNGNHAAELVAQSTSNTDR